MRQIDYLAAHTGKFRHCIGGSTQETSLLAHGLEAGTSRQKTFYQRALGMGSIIVSPDRT
jgi:hypothetical protein